LFRIDRKQKTASAETMVDEIAEMIANPIDQIQQFKSGDARLVGDEVLDGRTVQLYQLDDVAFLFMGGKGTTKIWVDPRTQLPVRIVIEPKKRKDRSAFIEISNFEWSKALDASLFSIPEDYTVMDANRWMKERRKAARDGR
jgi:outer membrane lipoprotein-sorting protein